MNGEQRKIGIVHDWLAVMGGAEETLREIVGMYDGPILTSQFNPDRFPFLKGREVRTSWVQRMPMALTRHFLYAPVMPSVYRSFDMREFDLVLTDSHSFAHHVRKRPDAVHVCYYYTPARSLWTPEIDNRALGGRLRWLRKRLAAHLKKLDLEASKGPDYRMAISHTIAERVERFYGKKVDKVVYPPVDTERWSDVVRTSEDAGFLMWGRLIPYKKFDLAIQAARITGDPLQIVGSGPFEPELKKLASGAKNVTFHGRLPDEDLKVLMGRCRAVLFPCYEDFGIVPVEAMSAGIPVIAYGEGAARETVVEGCGLLFAEQSPQCLADAMKAIRSMEFDGKVLKENASRFSRQVFREGYRAGVEEAWSRGPSKGQ
jgi:glycosyltransferase involved in cell wall biosynthesis